MGIRRQLARVAWGATKVAAKLGAKTVSGGVRVATAGTKAIAKTMPVRAIIPDPAAERYA